MTNILWIHFATGSIPRTKVTEPIRVPGPGHFLTLFSGSQPFSVLPPFSVHPAYIPTQHHLCPQEKPQCRDAGHCRHQFSTSLFVASTFLAPAYSGGRTWVTLILARKQAKLNWDTENGWQDNNEADVPAQTTLVEIYLKIQTELVTRWG